MLTLILLVLVIGASAVSAEEGIPLVLWEKRKMLPKEGRGTHTYLRRDWHAHLKKHCAAIEEELGGSETPLLGLTDISTHTLRIRIGDSIPD